MSSKHRELPAWTSLYRRAEFFFLGMGGGSYIGPFGRYDSTKTTYETLSFDDIESAIRRKHPEWPVQKIKRSATERLANRERKMHGEQSRAEYASPEMYFQADGYVQFLVQLSQISEVVLMLDNGSDPEGDAIETLCKNSQRVLASDLSREHILFARSWSPLVVATA